MNCLESYFTPPKKIQKVSVFKTNNNVCIILHFLPFPHKCWVEIVLNYISVSPHIGPYYTPGARRSTRVFASFSPTQFSFSHPAPRCLNSKCICALIGRAGMKTRCYFEELKIDSVIDLKPGLKSMAQYLFCYLKSTLVENAPLAGSTTCIHYAYYTQGCAAAHKHAKYNYSVKEYYCVGCINIKMS